MTISPHTDIHVITLQQYLYEKAVEFATTKYSLSLPQLENYSTQLLHCFFHSAHEFVHVQNNSITIGVDRDKLNKQTFDYALSLLYNIPTLTPNKKHKIGKKVQVYESTIQPDNFFKPSETNPSPNP